MTEDELKRAKKAYSNLQQCQDALGLSINGVCVYRGYDEYGHRKSDIVQPLPDDVCIAIHQMIKEYVEKYKEEFEKL